MEIGSAFAGAGVALLHNGTTSQDDPHQRPSRTEISILSAARADGLPVAAPITDIADVEAVGDSVDVVQLAGYHMQNYRLLKELGQLNRPVILRRGTANTVDELSRPRSTSSSRGTRTLLCEDGIRTFERLYELTLDFAAVPLLKERTHLPIVVDPVGGGPPEPRRAPRAGRRGGGRGRDHPRGGSRRPEGVPGHRGAGDGRRRRAQPLASGPVSADVQASPAQGQPAASEGRSDRKPPWMPILGAIVSVLSLAGVVWWALGQEPPTLPDTPARWAALAGAIALYGVATCVRGERWQALLRHNGAHPKRADSYALTAVGYMGNNVLPARAGDAFRVVFMAPRADTGARTVIGTLVAERLLDIAVLGTAFLVLTFGVVDHAGLPSGSRLRFVAGAVIVAGIVAAAAIIVAHRRGHLARLWAFVAPMIAATARLRGRHGAEMLGTTVVIWALEASVWWATGEASGLDLGAVEACYLLALASMFAMIPSGPGYAGTMDAAVIFGARVLDRTASAALSYLLLLRFVLFVPITLVGLVLLVVRYGGWAKLRSLRPAT